MKSKAYRYFILLFASLFAGTLLLTSCLADYLNDKYGFTSPETLKPITLSYSSGHSAAPDDKRVSREYKLTSGDLPELSEQGYIFDGWYFDYKWTRKAQTGDSIEEDTILVARWIPRDDIPYIIYNYFMNPRETPGSYEFVLKPEYTQYCIGTTGAEVTGDDYILRYSELYAPELDDYYICFDWNEFKRIKGDGSTIIKRYFYLKEVYDYEFAQMFPLLPDRCGNLDFVLIEQTPSSSYDFSTIKSVLDNYCHVINTYYDFSQRKYIDEYNKSLSLSLGYLSFTEIPAYAFYNEKTIGKVSLPNTCTKIGAGAFYGCDNFYIAWLKRSSTGTWRSSDGTDFGSDPDYKIITEILKSDETISFTFE